MIDTSNEYGRMFERLARALHNRRTGRVGNRTWASARAQINPERVRPGLDALEDYRHGDPPLRADIHTGWKPYVRKFVRMGRLNMADLLITSTANRLQLRDFRTSAADDELGDVEARKIMRANGMKVVARDVTEMALAMGDSYTLVTPPGARRPQSLITAEDPRQVITSHNAATGAGEWGLKLFRSEWDDEDLAYLYAPDGLILPARLGGGTSIRRGPFRFDPKAWTWDDEKKEQTPTGDFPLTRFRNRDGVGEFEKHLDTLDRINDKIFDEWWIAKIQAFRQRAVKNLPETKEVERDGQLVEEPVAADEYDDMFTSSPDEMWQVPGDVDFWESTPVDLTPITNAIEKDRQRLAANTSTPLHTITPDAAAGSAEGASLLREEHTFKCEDRRDRFDPSWARTMSLAFLFQGEADRGDVTQIEPQYAPIVRHSLTEKGSAASQAVSTLPREIIQRDIWQYEPSEILELRKLQGRDVLFQTPSQGAGALPRTGTAGGSQ
ncbi:phage portal protein [Nocardioides lentus]|uniref:Phage portal protein n=1 Tax=Nocardioides lentus TaxID=338077 RepID=A0ABP5AF11_9ACTN